MNGLDIALARHLVHETLGLIVRDESLRAAMVYFKPSANGFLAIVRPLRELGPTFIANPGHARRLADEMVRGLAARANPASRQPAYDLLVLHQQYEHGLD